MLALAQCLRGETSHTNHSLSTPYPTPEVLNHFEQGEQYWGHLYRMLGQYQEAIKDYDKDIELDSENIWPYHYKGMAYRGLEQYELAIQSWKRYRDEGLDQQRLSGTFAGNSQSLGNEGSLSVALGDLDGDGDLDAFKEPRAHVMVREAAKSYPYPIC